MSRILFQDVNWQRVAFFQKRFLARGVRSVQPKKELLESKQESILEKDGDYDSLGLMPDDHVMIHGTYAFDKDHLKNLNEKFDPLLNPGKKTNSGKFRNVYFGKVRLDSENIPKRHGEFEKTDEKIYDSFDAVVKHLHKNKDLIKRKLEVNDFESSEKKSVDPLVDIEIPAGKPTNQNSLATEKIHFKYASHFQSIFQESTSRRNRQPDTDFQLENNRRMKNAPKDSEAEPSLSEKLTKIKLKFEPREQTPKAETVTAADYLKEIRSGKRVAHFQEQFDEVKKMIDQREKFDSKGFRILKNQVPDFTKVTNNEILDILEKQILFNDADIVAIDKPYGMTVHGGKVSNQSTLLSKSRVSINLTYFLPELANRLGCSKLYTVHRLDKSTTGILLFSKTQSQANKLNHLFANHEITKKYLCITKNVPDHPEGIVDIPIEIGWIKGPEGRKRERMVLCPEPLLDVRNEYYTSRSAKRAVTKYKVLSQNGNAALLELYPETGIRHQLRVHLGFGLRCPILGDHKYSQLDSLAPQKLPTDMLMALRVRQAKVRHIPMHLHAHVYVLPEVGTGGRNVFIRAPLPYHFRKNMSRLKLRLE